MNIDRRHFAVIFAAACFFGVGADAVAQPAPTKAQPVSAEVMVLHATQEPGSGSIDPQIGTLPQLKKPPFSAYNTYKLIGKTSLALEKGKGQPYTLVTGRVLQVTLQDVIADAADAKPPVTRYKVAAVINQPNGKDFLKLLEVTTGLNETFFVAGQSYDRGILVIGITIKPTT